MAMVHKSMRWCGAVLAVGLVAACMGSDDPSPEVRSTEYGVLRGVNDSAASGTYAWKGVPFAKPPVGDLRWQPPVSPAAWSGERDARRFGNACLQIGRIYGPGSNNTFDATIGQTLGTPLGNEDCLTLNIWRPATEQGNLPVLVFLHGGSAISGYTADPVYDGAALARAANAVVVTANYRLDVLGFLQQPAMHSGSQDYSGNYALMDNIKALQFVQRNVASFGGNAGNVTLMGQSAGAINALALLASPKAAGLFQKLLPISGGVSLGSNLPQGSLPTINPAAKYEDQANGLLAELMVKDGLAADKTAAAALALSWPADKVASYMRGQEAGHVLLSVITSGKTGSGPIPDGVVVPVNPIEEIKAGRYNKVPVLSGYTSEEGKLFAPFLALLTGTPGMKIDDAQRFDMMQKFNPDAPSALTAGDILNDAYLPVTASATGYNARVAQINSLFLDPSRDNFLNTLKAQQPEVWSYEFSWAQEPAPWNDVYGAAHAFDLPFIFGNFGPSVFSNATNSTANKPGRLALSNAMMASVRAFVQTGNPNHAGLGQNWQAWPSKLVFDASLSELRISQKEAQK